MNRFLKARFPFPLHAPNNETREHFDPHRRISP